MGSSADQIWLLVGSYYFSAYCPLRSDGQRSHVIVASPPARIYFRRVIDTVPFKKLNGFKGPKTGLIFTSFAIKLHSFPGAALCSAATHDEILHFSAFKRICASRIIQRTAQLTIRSLRTATLKIYARARGNGGGQHCCPSDLCGHSNITAPSGKGASTAVSVLNYDTSLAKNVLKYYTSLATEFVVNAFTLNDNLVSDWSNVDVLSHNKQLVTVYLDHNPIAKDTNYRRKIKLAVPWISQIDATLAR
ncbi:Protein phosphatase 1 regulatory subunit 7 [Homalodisca vitripennis]|nr:Protein phosphatase 1 regulatory subunit 7 [Homalodisca vitripennis]